MRPQTFLGLITRAYLVAQQNDRVGIGQVKSVGSVLQLWIFVQGAVKEMSEAPKNVWAHT